MDSITQGTAQPHKRAFEILTEAAEEDRLAAWDKYAQAALVGYMASTSIHDQPNLWQPGMACLAAQMADHMMIERQKRILANTAGLPRAGNAATPTLST